MSYSPFYNTEAMLNFKPITIYCINELIPFAEKPYTRSCDYTPGNLIMWSQFMHYKYAIEEETLFIECISQADMKSVAFLPPIGKMPIDKAISMLNEFCAENNITLRLTAVPEPMVEELQHLLPDYKAEFSEGWSDYIYDAESIATLQGKALNKKRNRYNKFITEHPDYTYSRCSVEDIPAIAKFLVADRECQHNRETNMRCYEQWQCIATVKNLKIYNQPAGIIKINEEVIAFTLGELFGDTLYIHIEKAKREISGAAEAINRLFINDMISEHNNIKFVNREEDLGDSGLRQAKKAYNPIEMLHRYELIKTNLN